MPRTLAYRIRIGGQTVSSLATENERLLLSLAVRMDMGGVGGVCEVLLGDPENTPAQTGDPLSVELDVGDGAQTIFTGIVDTVLIDTGGQRVTAYDSLRKLTGLETEASYENVDVDFVVKDLLQQAGAAVGTVTKGFKLASYGLTRSPGVLRQLLELAEWCGADLYTDGAGKAHFATPAEQGVEHTFQFAANVLRLELRATPPIYDSVEIVGEGAAANQGADKFYWLVKDLAGVSGKAAIDAQGNVSAGSSGQRPRRLTLGAVRTGEAAQQIAEAMLQALAARWLRGRLEVFGAPKVQPGDRVKIDGIPALHGAAALLQGSHALRVRGVGHFLSRNRGYVTRMDF